MSCSQTPAPWPVRRRSCARRRNCSAPRWRSPTWRSRTGCGTTRYGWPWLSARSSVWGTETAPDRSCRQQTPRDARCVPGKRKAGRALRPWRNASQGSVVRWRARYDGAFCHRARHRTTPGVRGVVRPGENSDGGAAAMAMTGVVKDELSRVPVVKPCCRKAEVSTLLRFAGGLTLTSGHIVIEAELDTAVVARRLRASISEVFGQPSELLVLAPGGRRKGNRYVVRVSRGGDSLARQAGLIDSFGRPVRGLPRQVVSGGICDCEAAWRGAFLVHGSLTEPGRSMALEITCPGSEAALALVGAARRLKISAKAREVRGVDRVVIRDGEAIAAMLTRLGAHDRVLAWEERRMRREVRATATRLANFDAANLRRSARAAVAAGARVERALEILGTDA